MNIFSQLVAASNSATPKVDKTVDRYKEVTSGEFCAKDAARKLKIKIASAYDTLQRMADDGLLRRTRTINMGHGLPTQFYRWP